MGTNPVTADVAAPAPLRDLLGRPLKNLRLSVTDRCNLRCSYCMPEAEYIWLPREDILHFEEMSVLVDAFSRAGVDRVRLTGGEPLLRRGLSELVHMLAGKPAIKDLALTTNGVMLADQAKSLHEAGLHRLTVSLDTLQPDRFHKLTRMDTLRQVLAGIDEASKHFSGIKLDSVIIRGTNEDELIPLIEYAKRIGAEIRFIEYMDVGGATQWSRDRVMSRQEMLDVLRGQYGPIAAIVEDSSAPADRFRLENGVVFGIISSTTDPFCRSCDRSRLTADGMWYRCLYATTGTDLRTPLRSGATPDDLLQLISREWTARNDRGAEERLAIRDRSPLVPASSLKKNPHLEMHTRGG
jgi:cyclic pyranopterin phosphate synthase